MKALKGQKGLSLIEVTIMLLVLMLLTGVLAPSIFDYIKDAQWVKVKEDCEAIALSVARLTRDVGPCLKAAGKGTTAGCKVGDRVYVLYSDGTVPSTSGANMALPADANRWSGTPGWNTLAANTVVQGPSDYTFEGQLTTNVPGYIVPQSLFTSYFPVGPQFNLGWRGAYLSAPIGPDPWGHTYMVNNVMLAVSDTDPNRINDQDTFCLSAGPDGIVTTPFWLASGFGTQRSGDDFTTVISGSTR